MDDTVKLDIDVAYRRGFDQAIAFLLLDSGAAQHQVNKLLNKKRVAAWRAEGKGWIHDLRQDAPRMTKAEHKQLIIGLAALYRGETEGIFDA